MAEPETMYIANLAFFLNYDQGSTNDEIEYEIFRVAFQQKEAVHYDRSSGGGFQNLEQEPSNVTTVMKFATDLIESIYILNSEKEFDPYIVVGYNDITVGSDEISDYLVQVDYRLLQDLSISGDILI